MSPCGVVQYPISTSNHNPDSDCSFRAVVVQYPISTSNHNQMSPKWMKRAVVQYPISTSNHNYGPSIIYDNELYSIQFLHQITTTRFVSISSMRCIVSNFYIKSQLLARGLSMLMCCIVSNFYIKSQPSVTHCLVAFVVQYPISTSNHNVIEQMVAADLVVQYPISTSNHNPRSRCRVGWTVVQYPISTSNHNR